MEIRTYLDICLTNLQIIDLINNKIDTRPYNSDHESLQFTVKLPSNTEYMFRQDTQHTYNYKATKWSKFEKKLNSNYISSIPDNRNLNIKEIDSSINNINQVILKTIEKTVPSYKPHNNIHKYFNHRIKKLQKNKTKKPRILHQMQKDIEN